MRKLIGTAAAFGLLLPQAAAASSGDEWDVPQPAWEGVWQGTIGNLPVHVCLDKTPYDQKGAYYYDRVKRLFRLVPAKASGEWFEQEVFDKNGAKWRISVRSGALIGSWSDGKKQLPVHLTRIGGASRDFDGPCGTMAFNQPRVAAVKLESKRGSVDGVSYTTWTFKPGRWFDSVDVSTFTLDRPGAGVDKVNAILRAVLPKADGTGDWLDCVAGNANASGMDGSFTKVVKPTLVTERWLAASEQDEYFCGGAHPDGGEIPRTFDLLAGTEVNPLDWLGPNAVEREDVGDGDVYRTLTDAFRKLILSGWKAEDPDCADAMRQQDSWKAGIAPGALIFTPDFPHVVQACGEEFKIPFAKLQPWLNAKGKAAVATLPR